METIKGTLENVMRVLDSKKKRYAKDNPQTFLKKALTKRELGHIKFNYLKEGTLDIVVDSSSWLYHLGLKKETLLAKLNKQTNAVKKIRLHLGEVR